MKANFALMLSFDGLRLLHRASGSWQSVGDVRFEAEDLDAQLATLRRTALGLAPGGMRSKLVLPDDQLKYMRVETGDVSLEDRIAAVRAALEAATPYAIDELQFDIAPSGDATFAAAVARETLQEAEAFTAKHRLGPICWVSCPTPDQFPGEPFFGATTHAASLLAAGERVEPDGEPVRLTGSAHARKHPLQPVMADDEEVDEDAADILLAEDDSYEEESDVLAEIAVDAPPLGAGRANPAEPQIADVDTGLGLPGVFASRRDVDLPDPPNPSPGSAGDAVAADAEMARAGRRTGLILAGVAAISLGALALWSALSSNETEQGSMLVPAREAPEAAAPTAGIIATDTLLLPELAPADPTDPETQISQASLRPQGLRAGGAEVTPVALPGPLELPAPMAAGQAPRADPTPRASAQFDRETALQFYGRTGIWTIPPDRPDHGPQVPLDDFYLTSIDPPNLSLDAVALMPEDSFAPDDALTVPGNPAAAGARFALDGRGLVEATPEGNLSPDGVLIYAGRPPAAPTSFPDRPDEEPGLSVINDVALQGVRARLRPGNFDVAIERQQLGGLSRSELAAFRPRLRPEVDKQEDEADSTPTAQATAQSRRPATRPGSFGDTVARILAARTLQPGSTAQGDSDDVQVAAAAAPRTIAPDIPSSASVARQATVRNAINLKRLALMGIYGTPTDRRALVRLPSGRYKKVEIGDRLDGGRVSSINETELRYRKGSRDVILKMPKI